MSENVFIEGLAPGVPQWATERTTEKVLAAVKRNSGRTEAVKSAIERLRLALTVSHQDQKDSARKVETALGEVADATKDSKKHSAEQGKQAKKAADTLREASGALQSAATAQQAEAALRDAAGEDTGAAQASEQLDELGKSTESLSRVMKKETERMKQDIFFNFDRTLSSSSQNLGKFGAPLAGINRMLGRLATAGGKLNVAFAGLTLVVGGAAGFLGALVRIVQDSSTTLKAMNDVGLIQIRSATELARLQGDLAMSSEQLTSMTREYAREMGTFGFDSLQSFMGGADDAEKAMHRLGLTLAEGTTFAAQYLRQQRLASIFEASQTDEERERFQGTMQNLTAFSRILNVSREEIMKVATEIMESEHVRARFAAIQDDQQRENMRDQVEQITMMFAALGPEGRRFADLFGQAVGALDPMLVEDLYGFLPFAGEAVMNLMDMARRAAAGLEISPLEQAEAFEEFHESLKANSQTIAFMAQMGDQQAQQAMVTLASYEEARSRFDREMENRDREQRVSFAEYMIAEENRTQALVQSQVRLQDVFNRIRLRFNEVLLRIFKVFAGPGGVEAGVEMLGTLFDSVGRGLLQFSLILEEDGGLMRALSAGIAKAMDVIIRGIADGMAASDNLLIRHAGRMMGGRGTEAERRARDMRQEAGVARPLIATDLLNPLTLGLKAGARARDLVFSGEAQQLEADIRNMHKVVGLIGQGTDIANLISDLPAVSQDVAAQLAAAQQQALEAHDTTILAQRAQAELRDAEERYKELKQERRGLSGDEARRHDELMGVEMQIMLLLRDIKTEIRNQS